MLTYKPSDITVYVPCYNVRDVQPVIEALSAQSAQPASVLLVDDGSDKPLQVEGVQIIRHPENHGLATARNTALKHCKTDLLAALDADVQPELDWLERLLDALNREDVVGVGGRMDEHVQKTLGDRWRAVHMAQHWGAAPITHPRFLYGANTLFVAEALRSVGGYDERHLTNDEDRTMSDALYDAGHELFYEPEARCRHLREDTVWSILRGYWQWHHTKGLLNGEFLEPAGLMPRIELVNFGIFRYRLDTDVKEGRSELLGLDACIPWVFCARDLEMLAKHSDIPVPAFPPAGLFEQVDPAIVAVLKRMTPCDRAVGNAPWFDDYCREFQRVMVEYGWFSEAGDKPERWEPLLEEIGAV
jgi:glycosyltransferase involved in cell wall biosynthesis